MGALIKLIEPMYRKLQKEDDVDFMLASESDLESHFIKELKKASDKGKQFFSSEGDYAGSGSYGSRDKLFKALATEIGYFKG
jgi:hypothetical protein